MEEKTPVLTVRNVLRTLSIACIIFVFCPSFLVSCTDQTAKVNIMTGVSGVKDYGDYIAQPQPILLICLVLPIVFLFLLSAKKYADKKNASIILGCASVDIIVWFMFRSGVQKLADEYYCEFETTIWFVLNIIALVLTILLTALVAADMLQMDLKLFSALSGGGSQDTLNQMSEKMSQMSSAVTQIAGNVAGSINSGKNKNIGYCTKCGTPIIAGSNFCMNCGTPVSECILAEAENSRRFVQEKAEQKAEARQRTAEEKARAEAQKVSASYARGAVVPGFCHNCGAELEPNATFCKSCGSEAN